MKSPGRVLNIVRENILYPGLDCANWPNGGNLTDNCGVCDAKPTNDCTPDCNGVWGGTGAAQGAELD